MIDSRDNCAATPAHQVSARLAVRNVMRVPGLKLSCANTLWMSADQVGGAQNRRSTTSLVVVVRVALVALFTAVTAAPGQGPRPWNL